MIIKEENNRKLFRKLKREVDKLDFTISNPIDSKTYRLSLFKSFIDSYDNIIDTLHFDIFGERDLPWCSSGYSEINNLRDLYSLKIINHEETWFEMGVDREILNEIVPYSEIEVEICSRIIRYAPMLRNIIVDWYKMFKD